MRRNYDEKPPLENYYKQSKTRVNELGIFKNRRTINEKLNESKRTRTTLRGKRDEKSPPEKYHKRRKPREI